MGTSGDSIHILHVDDEPDFAEMAADFLEREDDRFTVTTATSASDGLDRLAAHEIDCVVSDYDMPGTNGIEFLTAVREEHPDLPFILYTGKGSEEVASDAIAAGATDYLQKGRGTDQYELLANRVWNAVDQYRGQQRAAELDRVRTLASDINQALVRAPSREEAEASICEIISDSDPYLFAWIGGVDPDTGRIEPRTSAGIEADYLDEITVTVDESPTGRGPGGTAVRERRVAVSQNIQDDPEFDPWREQALERGFRAVAAVPLEYQETLSGVLVVYAERTDAFDDDERELLAELGDNIAHAIHGFETRAQLRGERDRRQALFENAPGPVIAGEIHEEGANHRIVEVNDAFEAMFGYDATEVIGMDVTEVVIPEEGMASYEEFRERALAGETITAEVTRITADGPREFLIHVIPYGTDGDRAHGTYVWYTDITEREQRAQAIEALHATARAFMEAETAETIAEIAVDAVRDILDMPANGVHLYDEETEGLVPVAWTTRTEEIVGKPPTFAPGEGIAGAAFATDEAQIYDDISTVPERYDTDTDVRSQIALPLADHGVLVIGSPEPHAFDDTDVSLAQTLAAHMTTALARLEREQTLHQTRERYQTLAENFPNGAVLVFDTDLRYQSAHGEGFETAGVDPAAFEGNHISAVFDGETLETKRAMYEATLAGESRQRVMRFAGRVYRVHTLPVEDERGEIYAGIVLTQDITEYKQRERALERQNERLEEFASIVSHDLRNPLSVAEGRVELAMETGETEHLEAVERAHERMRVLIEDLLSLAREEATPVDIEPVDLAAVVEECWATVDTAEATLVVDTDVTIRADRSRLQQLLENFYRNAVEHGGDDVTITVGALDDGFYLADDGPGIPPDEREDVFNAGYSTSQEGTGFGLSIVQEIVEAHGWGISVTDSEAGGARFEIVGVELA